MLKSDKKSVGIEEVEVLNTRGYICTDYMLNCTRSDNTGCCFKTSIVTVSTALFQDSGDKRFANTKSVLKQNLEVELSTLIYSSCYRRKCSTYIIIDDFFYLGWSNYLLNF